MFGVEVMLNIIYERILNISKTQPELLRVEKLAFHNFYGVSQ